MNIHIRTTARLLKTMFFPAIVGVLVAIMFEYLPMEHILLAAAVSLVIFMFYLFYKWTLDQIKQEDQLKAMSNKE